MPGVRGEIREARAFNELCARDKNALNAADRRSRGCPQPLAFRSLAPPLSPSVIPACPDVEDLLWTNFAISGWHSLSAEGALCHSAAILRSEGGRHVTTT